MCVCPWADIGVGADVYIIKCVCVIIAHLSVPEQMLLIVLLCVCVCWAGVVSFVPEFALWNPTSHAPELSITTHTADPALIVIAMM